MFCSFFPANCSTWYENDAVLAAPTELLVGTLDLYSFVTVILLEQEICIVPPALIEGSPDPFPTQLAFPLAGSQLPHLVLLVIESLWN